MKDNLKKKILITGGSGFVGTNAVDYFLASGHEVLNIDIQEPQNRLHYDVFKKIDLLDITSIMRVFSEFAPTHVVHLAARTDLHEKKDISGYSVNIKGVENIVEAVSSQSSVEKCIFASTKLISPTDHTPTSDKDYCPNTLYGESKVAGEKIVLSSKKLKCDWCIVRPTSIWGPWSLMPHIPYGRFFLMISKGLFFYPGNSDMPKIFGYVGNAVFQIEKLMDATREQLHRKVFYLSDYEIFTIKEWANVISLKLRNKKVKTIPEPLVQLFAKIGDIMKRCGIQEPPFSSFRLRNMRADTTGVPLNTTSDITGPLPYSMEQGVDETIKWFREHNYIK